jgi:ribonuclease P protein component
MLTGSQPSAPSLRLPRICRIKQGRDFARLKAQGRRLVNGCLILNCLPAAQNTPGRLGVVASRKVGGSVVRSRARRLMREVWRRNQHAFTQPLELVLVARASIVGKPLASVERDFLGALQRSGFLKRP